MTRRATGIVSMALLAAVMAAVGADAKPKVKTWEDRARPLTEARTYDWTTPPPSRPRGGDVLRSETLDGYIVGAIDRTLSEKRLERDAVNEVDFLIAYQLTQPSAQSDAPRIPRCARGRCNLRAQPREQRSDNQLYIEFQDPDTLQPVWRGFVRPVLDRSGDIEGNLIDAVEAVLAEFPSAPRARE